MVSNLSLRSIFLIVLLTLCLSIYGQSVKNYYVSKMVDGGTLYHLFEQTLFQSEAGDDISYDLTYNSVSDSVTMSITLISESVMILDSLKVESENINIESGLKRLYIEPKGKKWMHRYSMSTHSGQFFKLYDAESNPQITLYGGENEYVYNVKRSAWKKYLPIGNKIFNMLELQRSAQ